MFSLLGNLFKKEPWQGQWESMPNAEGTGELSGPKVKCVSQGKTTFYMILQRWSNINYNMRLLLTFLARLNTSDCTYKQIYSFEIGRLRVRASIFAENIL